MQELSKTARLLSLSKWLIDTKKAGISKENIIQTFNISEKTFLRDVKDLQSFMPFLKTHYEKYEKRLYGEFIPSQNSDNEELLQEATSNDRPLPSSHNEPMTLFKQSSLSHTQIQQTAHIHFHHKTQALLSKTQVEELLHAALYQREVLFSYKGKQRQGIPLFLYYYQVHWYLFNLITSLQEPKIVKYRFDLIDEITPSLIRENTLSKEDIKTYKQKALKQIKAAHNLFTDLNSSKRLRVELRFFLPLSYLKKEISHYKLIKHPSQNDKTIVDLALDFSGFEEARMFLNQWLGKVQILSPEEFRKQYMDTLEDALDII